MMRHQHFEVLVGVAGQTGAGKTSLLNALLGVYELLPSGHEQAATAVSCKVSWNYDMRPGNNNCAEIFFQTEKDIRDQIIQTLKAFRNYRNVETSVYTKEDDRLNDLAEEATDIKDGMDKIYAIWRVTNDEVKTMALACDTSNSLREAADQILKRNETVLELLSSETKTFACSDPEALGKLIKPYLDSTTDSHGHRTGEFAAWPLIKNVNIYLRSDILRTGICLVDLPGVGDNVESRARIAEDYRRKLEVTMIVAAIHRAADEKTTQKLLSDSEEMRMRMAQGYNAQSFGVVLSKMDDLDWEGYIKRSKDAEGDPLVQAHSDIIALADSIMKQLSNESKEINKIIKKRRAALKRLAKKKETAETRVQRSSFQDEVSQCQERTDELRRLIADKEKIIKLSNLHLKHWAINKRNAIVQARLEDDHERRQRQIACEDDAEADISKLNVRSTSSRAFWELQFGKKGTAGFPAAQYTGIPGVIQWIHLATSLARERHLDVVLNIYRSALDGMDQWCKTDNIDLDIEVDLQAIVKVLDAEYKRFRGVSTYQYSESWLWHL